MMEPHIERFPDGDAYVRFEAPESVIFMRLYPDQDKRLMEAFLVADSLYPEVRGLTLLAPYMPYARQDKRKGLEPLSFHLVLRLLAVAGYTRVITVDLHSLKEKDHETIQGLDIVNVHAYKELKKKVVSEVGPCVFVAPDEGAKHMADVHFEKVREGIGVSTKVKVLGRTLEDKKVCLIDDIVAGGGTMLRALDYLDKAEEVYVATIHGLFLGDAADRLKERGVKGIFSTNTVPNPYEVVDVVPLMLDSLS